jgi:RHS repeat-associated protein
VTNNSGTVLATTSYDAWGNPQTTSGLTNYTPIGYTGAYTDPTGLDYLQNRYYDPTTAQFLTVDPAVSTTQQPYQYTSDNPINNVDPSGLFSLFGHKVGFHPLQGLKGAANFAAGAANFAVSTVTLGNVHISAPFCGYGLGTSYSIGKWTAAIETGLAGGGEADISDAAADTTAAEPGADSAAGAGADFVVDSRGTAIPTDAARLRSGLEDSGAFQDTSTNPAISRKFVGMDDGDPIRIRVEKGHFDDPNYTGPNDPLHTIDHLHVELRANGATGPWTEAWKIPYEWPF